MRQSLRCRFLVHALFSLSLLVTPGPAATLLWDSNSGTAGAQDGGGTWSSSSTTWFNTGNSANNQAFVSGDSVIFGAGNAAAGTVTVSGTVGTVSAITFNAATTGTYTLSGGTLNFGGGTTITSNANATISSTLNGSGGWTKAGTGTLSLTGTGTNGVTGAFNLNAGMVTLNKLGGSDSQLPQAITSGVSVNLGNGSAQAVLRLDRNNQISDSGTVINFAGTGALAGILRMNGSADTVGTVRSSTAGAGIIENGHISNAATLTVGNTAADTFSGIIQNGGTAALNFAKSNAGTLTLTGVSTYTGSTAVRNGTLELTGTASIAASTSLLLNSGGTLKLANTAAANGSNRVNDTAPLTLAGGTLALTDDGTAASYSETVGAASAVAGASTLSTVSTGTGSTTLSLASLTRQAGATVNFAGTALGVSAQNRILIGGGFGVSDHGLIGGWATAGNEFAKYDPTNGVTALTAADYETGGETAWTFESNAKLTADATLTASRVVNSLNLAPSVTTLALGGQTLRVESGGILVSGSAPAVISGGTLTGGTSSASRGELIVHQNASAVLEISASIADNGGRPVSLLKSGSGTLKLSGSNTFSGGLFLNAGTLQIGSAGALPSTGAVALEGGMLELNGFDVTIGSLSSQALNTGGLVTNTATGGTKTLTVGNDGGSSSFSGQLGLNLNFTKTGAGTLTFNQSNASYGGIITVAQGTLVTANPTSLGTATGTNDKTVILPGGTLDIAGGIQRNERLEISGHGFNGQGALMLNSGESQNLQFATLTGHSTFSVNVRYDFDNQLAGGGFNLTKIGIAELALEGNLVQNLGDVHVKQGNVTWSGNADLGVATNTLFVDAGSAAQFYNKASDIKQITLAGGTLRRSGTAGGAAGNKIDVQGGLNLAPGASSIVNSNSSLTFQLNALNRSLGATLNFDAAATTGLATTDTVNTNGIIGGYATFNGNTWAVSADSGGDIAVTGLAVYNTNDFGATANNVDVSGAQAPASFTVNTLRFNTAGAAVLTLAGVNTVSSGGLLVTGTVGANQTRITGGSLRGAANGDLVVIQNNGTGLTIESVIENNGTSTALTKAGTGTLTLTGNNTFSGGTYFVGGTLSVSKLADTGDSHLGNSAGGSDNAWIFNTGRLQYSSAATADATTARDIQLLSGGGIIEVATSGRSLTLNGVISSEALLTGEGTYTGSSMLTKEGAGTLVLGGAQANTSTGVTLINAGILRLNKTAGVDALAGNVTLGNNSGGLDILLLGASNQIKDTSLLTINGTAANAGILRLAGQSETIAGLISSAAGTGIVENESGAANTGTLAVEVAAGASYTFSGILRNGDGSGTDGVLAFTKKGSGTQILSGTNTYTGDTTVEGGSLQIGVGGTAGALANGSRVVLAGGSLEINRSNAYAFGNQITGSGTFVHAGTGITTLSNGSSNYTGTTEIRSGTVLVGNASGSATGSSVVDVNGGLLGGTGIIAGATTVRESGRLAPGDPAVAGGLGTLTFGSDLTLKRQTASGQPVLTLQLGTINDLVHNDAAGIAANSGNLAAYFASQLAAYEAESGSHDRLVIGGTLHLEAGAVIAVDNSLGYTPKFGDVFDLLDWNALNAAGSAGDRNWTTGLDLQLPTLTGGLNYDFSLFASAGIIVVTPEPGRMLLLVLGASLLLVRRRRSGAC